MPLQPHELDVLQSAPIFGSLPDQARQKLISTCETETWTPGSRLFRQGDAAKSFFVILEGWIKVVRELPAGMVTVIDVLSRGNAVAEATAVAGGAYPASAETVTRARTLRIRANVIRTTIRANPNVALALIDSVANQNRALIEDIERLKSCRALERVAGFIASLTTTGEGATTLRLPFDKVLIAARLGIQPESLSRVFVQLRELGIHVEKDRVAIRDVASLRSLVGLRAGAAKA